MREEVSVVVVGAGPAGCAAAIFLKRAGFEPVLLEESTPGGLLREANLVENYPGFPEGITGRDLADLIREQLARLEIRPRSAHVKAISTDGPVFVVQTDDSEYESKAVIMATGTVPRKLDIPGARELEGRRLFYGLALLDLESLAGKRIVILGGGDAAFDYALNLRAHGNSLVVVTRSTPTCLPLLRERAEERGIEVLGGCVPQSIEESGGEVKVMCPGDRDLACDLVVVAHGREPRLEALSAELAELVRASADIHPETAVEGFYVAGDVIRGKYRQTAIAAGDGVLAAMKLIQLLEERGVRG